MASSSDTEGSEAKRAGQVVCFGEQSYKELKRRHLEEETLFFDPKFQANLKSLGTKTPRFQEAQWRRPQDTCRPLPPQFISNGMTRTDIVQGNLGDCWFLAAAASLTLRPQLLQWVVSQDQSFDRGDYAGIFHFQFWQFGQWMDVVVDDQLPCVEPPGRKIKLLLGKSSENDEFWMPLLEKAYAKLNGSYELITGGFSRDAFVDLTGGIGETVWLKPCKPYLSKIIQCEPYFNLSKMIQNALERNSLMAASLEKGSGEEVQGLETGHTYSITGFRKITVEGKKEKLLRLRNPWGHSREWTGDWSDDDSQNWSKLNPEQRQEMLVKKNDGEFWMKVHDFHTTFDCLHVCHLSTDAPKEGDECFRWASSCFRGRLLKCQSPDTLWMNPQFHVSLLEPDEGVFTCTLLVSLMQEDQRRSGKDFLKIGFAIYKMTKEYVKLKDPARRKELLSNLKPLHNAIRMEREATERFELSCGDFLIIPRKEPSEEEAGFLLRLFTEKKHYSSDITLV